MMAVENSAFREFHDELRSVGGDLLAKDRTVDWAVLAEAGWTGLEIPEELGGAGATFAEVAVILDEMGRAASATSYLGSAVLAVGALKSLQPTDVRDKILAGIASGELRPAVATGPFRLDGRRLSGTAEFVLDAECADPLLVIATDANGIPAVVVTSGLVVTTQPVVDETRRLATVAADGVEIGDAAVQRFDGDPHTQVRRLSDRAAVAVACDSLGLVEAMLSATVAYAKVRHQFGRPIGSFQAVKHACADMLVQISVARQLVRAAVEAVADDRPDAPVATSMAKSYVCAAAVDVVGKAMQLHGGIGYTWESGVHVYLKRAALNRALFGSPAAHRKELAARYR
jgi:alkylation response protein AidB-like acyl-CoA dehydrogenase